MEELRCKVCGAPLTRDDVGATKKLINRGASSFFCVPCLAKYFSVEEDLIRQKIETYKKSGCTLFT
ncbi:MAG: hypothetical protein IJM21_01510 [Clostridia bacterium]|nr:hypothetical protein [Clostridia bacterium]